MIHGEEYWLGQLDQNEEYDLFFKKIRKKIKSLNLLKPIKKAGKITKPLINKKGRSPSKENSKPNVSETTKAREFELKKDREKLMAEMVDFEKKKVEELEKISEEKTAIEQASIQAEHGENKKMVYIALIGLGGLALVGGVIVWIKSRQNQLAALNLQDTA